MPDSAIEDVIPDRRDAGQAPARARPAGVEEERLRRAAVGEVAGRRCGRWRPPCASRARPAAAAGCGRRGRRRIGRLADDAADVEREAAGAGAVDDHFGDGELAGERLALGFEIDRAGEAFVSVGFAVPACRRPARRGSGAAAALRRPVEGAGGLRGDAWR